MFELESRPQSINPWRSLWEKVARGLRPSSRRAKRKNRFLTETSYSSLERLEDRALLSIQLNPFQWTTIGPSNLSTPNPVGNVSGRISSISGDPTNPNTIYVGTSGGGVWKTIDNAATWSPKSDFEATLVMGAMYVDPSNPNIIYAGTGDPNQAVNNDSTSVFANTVNFENNTGDSFYGRGLMKSVDGGNTWHLLGSLASIPGYDNNLNDTVIDNTVLKAPYLTPAQQALQQFNGEFDRMSITAIALKPGPNPADPTDDTIYLATSNRVTHSAFGQAGIYKSLNGGLTWTNTTDPFTNPRGIPNSTFSFSAFTDIKMHPFDPETLYAALDNFSLEESGLYKTTDGGNSWFRSSDFPSGSFLGRIQVTISPSNPNIVYATVANIGLGGPVSSIVNQPLYQMLRTTSGGLSWINLNAPSTLLGDDGDYSHALIVDPTNPQIVYVGGSDNIFKTEDGGFNWTNITVGSDGLSPHDNFHAFAFDANNQLLVGTDGGIWRLTVPTIGSIQWTNLNGTPGPGALNTLQFNGVTLDRANPDNAIAGAHNNKVMKYNGALDTWSQMYPATNTPVPTNDGGYVQVDPGNANTIYLETRNGQMFRSDDGGVNWVSIDAGVNIRNATNNRFPEVLSHAHFYLDPGVPSRIYRTTDRVWESNNKGQTWVAINILPAAGRPPNYTVSRANGPNRDGWSHDGVITALGVSTDHNILYAATSYYNEPFTTGDAFFDAGYDFPHLYVSVGRGTVEGFTNGVLTSPGDADWIDVTSLLVQAGVESFNNGAGLVPTVLIKDIRVDPQNPRRAYIIVDSFTTGGQIYRIDIPSQLFVGAWGNPFVPPPLFFGSTQITITDMTGDLPRIPIASVEMDPRQFGLPDDILFVGTDMGVYATRNFTSTQTTFQWTKFGGSIPNVRITDLELSKDANILVASTYGRGIWEIQENAEPILTRINDLAGAIEDTLYTIPYALIAPAQQPPTAADPSDLQDPNGDTVAFVLDTVTSGSVFKQLASGAVVPAVPGSTRLEVGETWLWQPPANLNGRLAAFTLKATDLELTSITSPVQVYINTAAVNDAPTLTVVNPLANSFVNQPYNIPYSTLLAASNANDVDNQTNNNSDLPLVFRVQAVNNGQLLKNGVPVTPMSTLLGPGETWTWVPPLNFQNQTAQAFTVVVLDPSQAASAPPVQVFIAVGNPPPQLTPGTITTGVEDQQLTISFNTLQTVTNANDPDGEPITFRIMSVANGTLTLQNGQPVFPGQTTLGAGASLLWRPPADLNNALNNNAPIAAFTVNVFNTSGTSTTEQVSIDVAAVADAPRLNFINPFSGARGTGVDITYQMLLDNGDEFEPDGDIIYYRLSSVTTGTLTKNNVPMTPGDSIGPGESVRWVPANNNLGMQQAFRVFVSDGPGAGALTSSFPVQVTVNLVNLPPEISTNINTLTGATEDTVFSISYSTLLSNTAFTDPNQGDPFSFRLDSIISGTVTKNGAFATPGVTLLGPGETWVWTPAADANGVLSAFTVKGFDGQLTSTNTATVNIDVSPVSDAPTMTSISTLTGAARNQPYSIPYNQLLSASDANDVDGDLLTFVITSISSGTVTKNGAAIGPGDTIAAGETVVWTPPVGAPNTSAAFTVVVFDGGLFSTPAVQVNVAVQNTIPTLTSISTLTGVLEDGSLTIPYSTLLAQSNAADGDLTPISFRIDAVLNGTLTKNGSPVIPGTTLFASGETLLWTPAANASGNINAFSVRAWDGEANSASSVNVPIFVTPVNDAPTLSSVNTLFGGLGGAPVTLTYDQLRSASNAADVDGDTIRFRIVGFISGTLTKNGAPVTVGTLVGPGETVVWTPPAGATTTTGAFVVQAFDGQVDSAGTANVSFDLNAVRMFRAYNPNAAYHFFTTNSIEFQVAVQHGYQDETTGRAGFAVSGNPVANTTAIHRLRNPNTGKHYYTPNTGERDHLVSLGWKYEKDEGFIYTSQVPGSTEVYKLYNRISGTHLYTENAGTRDAILATFPGIWIINTSLGFGFPLPPSGTITTTNPPNTQRAIAAPVTMQSTSDGSSDADDAASRQGVANGLAGTRSSAPAVSTSGDTNAASADSSESAPSSTSSDSLDEVWSDVSRELMDGSTGLGSLL